MIPEKCLENHIAILGKTGSGKSNAAKTVAESLIRAGERVCVIDPTGTWWGMRLAADGKRPSGIDAVVFGGNHADIPIAGTHGAAIAEAIGQSATSAIVDTRLMTVSDRTAFFTAFAETLLRKNRGPLHLIIDEAHLFAPQGKVNDPRSGTMVHAANNLVSLGRGIGLRIIMVSQRPAKLHKDSLTQAETLVAMRVIHNLDVDAVRAWIGECANPAEGKELVASLPRLEVGQAWVWAPALNVLERMKFPLASTFDTGTPITGQQQELPPIDIGAISARLETIAKDVVDNDPKKLKARIAALEKQLAGKAPAADHAAEKEAHADGYSSGFADGEKIGWNAANLKFREALAARMPKIEEIYAEAMQRLYDLAAFELPRAEIDPLAQPARRPVAKPTSPGPTHRPAKKRSPGPAVAISGKEPLLDAARAVWPAKLTWGQLASTIGRKARGGHFNSTRKRLIDTGAVVEEGGLVVLTDPPANGSASPADMLEANLPQPAQRMFIQIRQNQGLSVVELAHRLGMQPRGGHWNTGMAILKRNDLIVDRDGLWLAEGLE